MQGHTLGSHDDSIHFPEEMRIHQELTKLVQTLGWTYAVIWKPAHDNRVLSWYQSWFNNRGTEEGNTLEFQFQSVFRRCQFTQEKPGYAYRAWQSCTGTWWTRHMNPLPTDIHKELFLRQANIQTILCLPICAPDGTTCCVELATNVLEAESRELQDSIQAFLNESVAPYISVGHLPASSFLQQEVLNIMGGMSTQAGSSTNSADDLIQLPHRSSSSSSAQGLIAAMEVRGAASNPSTSCYTQVMQALEEEEPFGGYGVIARGEQDYMSWTLPGSNYASVALTKEYTGFVDPPSNSAGDHSLDVAVFKEYTQMATSHVPNPVVNWSPHQSSCPSTLGQVDQMLSAFNTPPSTPLDVNPHSMLNQGRPAAGLDSVSTQIQWDLDVGFAGQFEAPAGNLVPQPHDGHNLVGISQMLNPPVDHAGLVNLYNLGRMSSDAQPPSFQASGSAILSSQFPSTSAPRNHHSLQFRHDSSRSPFRSLAQIDGMQSRLQQQLSTSTPSASQASRLQGRSPYSPADVHAKPKGHLIQTWVRNWQDKRWQQQKDLDEAEFAGEDARSPQTIARDEHQAAKHMRAERVRRKIFNCRLQTLKSLVPIIHKKKDKVTVLSSTIDYIRHLTSSLENKAAGPPGSLFPEQQLVPADRPSANIIASQIPEDLANAGASSSITTSDPVIVEVEFTGNAAGSSTTSAANLVIRVEAQNHSRSLIHLLNVLHEGFGLQLTNLDYGCVNNRFHATITIENPGVTSMVCVQLREALQRELAASPSGSPSTDSD